MRREDVSLDTLSPDPRGSAPPPNELAQGAKLGRYIVLERQKLTYVLAEQDLGASGRVKRETAAPIGELEGAELLGTASVTGFDPGVAGAGGTAGGVLGNLFGKAAGQTLGNVAGGLRRAHLALDLRVIDT